MLFLLDTQFVFHSVKTGWVLDADSVAAVGSVTEKAGAHWGQAGSGKDQGQAGLGRDLGEAAGH